MKGPRSGVGGDRVFAEQPPRKLKLSEKLMKSKVKNEMNLKSLLQKQTNKQNPRVEFARATRHVGMRLWT